MSVKKIYDRLVLEYNFSGVYRTVLAMLKKQEHRSQVIFKCNKRIIFLNKFNLYLIVIIDIILKNKEMRLKNELN